jgi:hypothetical protein
MISPHHRHHNDRGHFDGEIIDIIPAHGWMAEYFIPEEDREMAREAPELYHTPVAAWADVVCPECGEESTVGPGNMQGTLRPLNTSDFKEYTSGWVAYDVEDMTLTDEDLDSLRGD